MADSFFLRPDTSLSFSLFNKCLRALRENGKEKWGQRKKNPFPLEMTPGSLPLISFLLSLWEVLSDLKKEERRNREVPSVITRIFPSLSLFQENIEIMNVGLSLCLFFNRPTYDLNNVLLWKRQRRRRFLETRRANISARTVSFFFLSLSHEQLIKRKRMLVCETEKKGLFCAFGDVFAVSFHLLLMKEKVSPTLLFFSSYNTASGLCFIKKKRKKALGLYNFLFM